MGSIRRERLDRVVVLDGKHFRRILTRNFRCHTRPALTSRLRRTLRSREKFNLPIPAGLLRCPRPEVSIIDTNGVLHSSS
jgi:hypothetical protein